MADVLSKLWPDPLDAELNQPDSPAWKHGGRVHNWQNYIGRRTRQIWKSLPDETKMAIAIDADELAGREDWD